MGKILPSAANKGGDGTSGSMNLMNRAGLEGQAAQYQATASCAQTGSLACLTAMLMCNRDCEQGLLRGNMRMGCKQVRCPVRAPTPLKPGELGRFGFSRPQYARTQGRYICGHDLLPS